MSPDNFRKPSSLFDIAESYEPSPSKEQVLNFREELEKFLQKKGREEYILDCGKELRKYNGEKFKILKYSNHVVVGERKIPFLAFRFQNNKPFKNEVFYLDIGMSLESERVRLFLSSDGKAFFDYLTRPVLPLFNSYCWQFPSQKDLDLYKEVFGQILNTQEKRE